uniref:Uncharacterized protein ycf35 n=1 Tax=Haptophyceae sp. NIES-3900 TaxID=2748608 RepID=A0A7R6WEY5_9EUKA|nr:conserved protein [Haptophyceae sp. NIES-3900]
MSHFSKIKTSLRDLDTLKMTLSDLEIAWQTNSQVIRGYNNQTHEAQLVIKQPNNNYDVGFCWNGNEFELVSDLQFWDQKYSVESFLDKVSQRYAYNSIISESSRKGFQATEMTNQEDGSIRLVINRWKG